MSGRRGSGTTEAEALLADLLAAGAIPLIENDRLRIEAPVGVLDARRERLASCLPELRAIVESRWRSREECVARRPCRRMSPCIAPAGVLPCGVDPTCCLCRGPLPEGHRYLCHGCLERQVEEHRRRDARTGEWP